MDYIRWATVGVLILFSLYTVHATGTENFWRSLKTVMALRWGRQVVADLYIGLLLFHFFVYLNEGSFLMMLAWLAPSLILGNLVTLVYFVLNFNSLLGLFL